MFADNQKISRIQMERQYLLAYIGPLVLWIGPGLQGRNGFLGILAGALFLCVWVFFLLRQVHVYRYPEKYWGKIMSRVLMLVYESYLLLTGGWLAAKAGEILQEYMIQGISVWLAVGLFILAALGSSGSLQERGRFAQTAWPIVGGIIFLMFLIAVFQVRQVTGTEDRLLMQEVPVWNMQELGDIWEKAVWFAAAFLGSALIPFLRVDSDGGAEYSGTFLKMIGKIALWSGAVSILLQVSFGTRGARTLEYPVLNLMAGVKIPGGFIRRIDMIFLTVTLFALLFCMGSIFFYCKYIWERMGVMRKTVWGGRIPAAVLCFLLAVMDFGGRQLVNEYQRIVIFIYLPLFLVITFCNALLRRRRYGK